MRYPLTLALLLVLSGCASERHFASDTVWPFGNPNAPDNQSETAQRALGKAPEVTPIAPQAGNVWPGAVQPVPTIADIEKNMNQPLGQSYTPSLPSPYPPGQQPPDTDSDDNLNNLAIPSSVPAAGAPPPIAPSAVAPSVSAPGAVSPGALAPGTAAPGNALQLVPANPHARK